MTCLHPLLQLRHPGLRDADLAARGAAPALHPSHLPPLLLPRPDHGLLLRPDAAGHRQRQRGGDRLHPRHLRHHDRTVRHRGRGGLGPGQQHGPLVQTLVLPTRQVLPGPRRGRVHRVRTYLLSIIYTYLRTYVSRYVPTLHFHQRHNKPCFWMSHIWLPWADGPVARFFTGKNSLSN